MGDIPGNFTTDAHFEGNIEGILTSSGSFSSTLDFAGDEDWIQVHLEQALRRARP